MLLKLTQLVSDERMSVRIQTYDDVFLREPSEPRQQPLAEMLITSATIRAGVLDGRRREGDGICMYVHLLSR